MCGYVKMYRSLTEHWLADQPTKLGWWLLLILKASHKDVQVSTGSQIIDLKRGQMVASLSYLASLWKTSKTTAERFLDMLVKNGMVERCTERKLTIITICNYDVYQGESNRGRDDMRDDMQDDGGTMMGTKQECKECKEFNNNNLNARTREERVSWESARELGFGEQIKATRMIAIGRQYSLNKAQIIQYIQAFLDKCQIGDHGHRDLGHFGNHLCNFIEEAMAKPTTEAEQPKKKVMTNEDHYELMRKMGWQNN